MKLKERIQNSIKSYIIGDTLGVPFEFQFEDTFVCNDFSSGGVHMQSKGIWSDDTSILLCLIDAMCVKTNQGVTFKQNLRNWYKGYRFNAGTGLFDIGCQTSKAIRSNFETEHTESMGNGALFYCLPVACMTLDKSDKETKEIFEMWCKTTHYNSNCFKYGSKFSCILKNLLRTLPIEIEVKNYENRGDVINTYNLCLDNFLKQRNKSTTLFEDLCSVVNLGEDTDTNAALFGSLIGCIKPVEEKHWRQVVKWKEIDDLIDKFVDALKIKE